MTSGATLTLATQAEGMTRVAGGATSIGESVLTFEGKFVFAAELLNRL